MEVHIDPQRSLVHQAVEADLALQILIAGGKVADLETLDDQLIGLLLTVGENPGVADFTGGQDQAPRRGGLSLLLGELLLVLRLWVYLCLGGYLWCCLCRGFCYGLRFG